MARSRGSSERTQLSETNSFGAPAFDAEASPPSTAPLAYFSTTRRGSLNSLCVPTSLDSAAALLSSNSSRYAASSRSLSSAGSSP